MVNFIDVVQLQLMLFVLLGVGFFLRKKKLVSHEARKSIINILIDIFLPCLIIKSFNIDFSIDLLKETGEALIFAFAAQIVYVFSSKYLYKMVKDKGRIAVLRAGTICSNAAYIGMPVSEGIYGSAGLIFASIECLPLRIFTWTFGTALFVKTSGKQVIKTLLTHPCIISVFIGIVLMFLGFPLPKFVISSINSLGNCSTAVSMIVVGMILAEISPKEIFNGPVFYFAALRLIVIPLVFLVILKALSTNEVVTGVTVLLAGMPAGSNTAVLASKYNGDEAFASQNIFVSTLLSMATIPIISLFL
ncbi:MAG: AEC family transporter [Clostridia bacterium]|nr:AEC family transporter [Clostridia bacterium]MCI2001110.1 AEC family transporter [Clostridia bacterium]MCI2015764.1 AEC family transporter [Clostridia bacterium]